jgi:hypothetical protein
MVPATTFKFEALGRVSPAGNTVTNEFAVGDTAVTFSTTAATPDAGTPPRPVTVTVRDDEVTAPPPAPTPSTVTPPTRVSSNRAGVTATYPPVAAASPVAPAASRRPDTVELALATGADDGDGDALGLGVGLGRTVGLGDALDPGTSAGVELGDGAAEGPLGLGLAAVAAALGCPTGNGSTARAGATPTTKAATTAATTPTEKPGREVIKSPMIKIANAPAGA